MYVRIDTVLPSVFFHASPVAFRMPDNGSGDSVKVGPLRFDCFTSAEASSTEPGSGAVLLFSSLTIGPHSRKRRSAANRCGCHRILSQRSLPGGKRVYIAMLERARQDGRALHETRVAALRPAGLTPRFARRPFGAPAASKTLARFVEQGSPPWTGHTSQQNMGPTDPSSADWRARQDSNLRPPV